MRPLELHTRSSENQQEIVIDPEEEDGFEVQPGMQMVDFPRSDSSSSSFSRKLSFGEARKLLSSMMKISFIFS